MKIALTGEMRSGKDTVAKYLIEQYGFERHAFGDYIKHFAEMLFPHEFEKEGKPRELLQDFGQFCVGKYKNVWVDQALYEIELSEELFGVGNIVVTDLRQPHEYEALIDNGFIIVRVNTKPHIRKKRMEENGEVVSEERFNHETEQYVRTFEVDYELDNNKDKEHLIEQVKNMLKDISGGEVT